MEERIRVGFDHRIFIYDPKSGMVRYHVGLASHLHEFGIDLKIIAPLYTAPWLRELPPGMVWGRQVSPDPRKKRAASVFGELTQRMLARMAGVEIVHETFYNYRRCVPARSRIVSTVHDMIPELFPQFFPGDEVSFRKAATVERADHIICVSENSKRDLLRFFPEVENRTSVVLLGIDPIFEADPGPLRPRKEPYMLFVGGRGGWKNFKGLLASYARSRLPRDGIDLVCIGGPLNDEEKRLIEGLGIGGHVYQFNADDAALVSWYRHAVLLAYPSLYEGFGIPPLEAMAAGCPVVAAHGSSLTEVCGNAAQRAEPGSIDSLVVALESVAFSPERQEELRALGREQSKRFSWRECARQTSEIYKSLV